MPRPKLVLAAIGGAVLGFAGGVAVSLIQSSSVSQLEKAAGFPLPERTRMTWERRERYSFIGDGLTLRIFDVSPKLPIDLDAGCPPGFAAGAIEESGVWPQIAGRGFDPKTRVCFKSQSTANRDESVVLTPDRAFYLRSDT